MSGINGLTLKTYGTIIISSSKRRLVAYNEQNSRGRTYYYLVHLKGAKYTRQMRLQLYERQFYKQSIAEELYLENQNGRKNNYKDS